jgi:hypothetical protein
MNTDSSNSKITSDCGEATEHKLTCAECCGQLPRAGAVSGEANDYVYHFCGTACYDKWRTRASHVDTGKNQTG